MSSSNNREYKGKNIIHLPNEFVVIDIETTGLYSVCDNIIELSAIKYNEKYEEIGRFSELVQPPIKIYDSQEYYVSNFISCLTGITNEMLKDARTIDKVLPEYIDFIGNSFIVGYNTNFDINFIYDNVEILGMNHFSNDYMDTMRLSRKLHKELDHHRLMDMAEFYNIDYTGAHRSLADCIITKEVLKNLIKEGIEKYGSFENIKALFKPQNKSKLKAENFILTINPEDIDIENPIYNKNIVFTGVLERMERKAAFQIVVNLGGIPSDSITKKTNILVLGNNDYCKSIKDGKSSKQKKAERLKLDGYDIEIIPENVFYEIIEESN